MTQAETPFYSNYLAASNATFTILLNATIVTSFPNNFIKPYLIILAFPIGIKQSLFIISQSITKFWLYISQFYKNITGFGSLIALFKRPLQSSASQGDRTTRPGTLPYQEAKHWECCAATAAAGPFNPLITMGLSNIPDDIYLILEQELIIESIACNAKFIVMYYKMGLSPLNDDPIAIPVNPAQLIGVSITLYGPNFSSNPFDTLYAP